MEGATFGITREGVLDACVEVGLKTANQPGNDIEFFRQVEEILLGGLVERAVDLPLDREAFLAKCGSLLREQGEYTRGASEKGIWLGDGQVLAGLRPGKSKHVSLGLRDELVEKVLEGVKAGRLPALSKDEFVRAQVAKVLRVMQEMTEVYRSEKWAHRQLLVEGLRGGKAVSPFLELPPSHRPGDQAGTEFWLRWIRLFHLKHPLPQ